jgi:hypothetical protein
MFFLKKEPKTVALRGLRFVEGLIGAGSDYQLKPTYSLNSLG